MKKNSDYRNIEDVASEEYFRPDNVDTGDDFGAKDPRSERIQEWLRQRGGAPGTESEFREWLRQQHAATDAERAANGDGREEPPAASGPEDYAHGGAGDDVGTNGNADQHRAKSNGARAQGERTKSPHALPLTFFDDLSEQPSPKPWLIKNVIARDETSSWIAPPGKGKSALLTDISISIASGADWRGYRTKVRAGVVYFALERADLVRRRLIAHKLRDGLGSLPIAVAGQVINLLNRNCVNTIFATIKEAEQRFGVEVALAIFDTYAKGIAAGGGDEDKAKDQNIVQANLRQLFDRGCHIHIAGIGHTGKDESRGERGSNARLADVDMQSQISGDAIKTVAVTKANDQPEGDLTAFKLEPFNFSTDEDGEPFRTYILDREVYATERGASRQKLSDKQVLALRALAEVTLSRGRRPPPDYQLPQDIKVVEAEAWQEELKRSNVLDGNISARFKELRKGLAARNLIGSRDALVWAASRVPP